MFSSCGYSKPNPDLEYAINNTIPTCTEGVDCSKKWEAAQVWIANNAGNKISIVTPVLIETQESDDEKLSIRATKELQDSLTYKVKLVGWCHNFFGCVPDHNESQYNFNQFINNYGKPKPESEPEEESLNKNGAYDKPWKK